MPADANAEHVALDVGLVVGGVAGGNEPCAIVCGRVVVDADVEVDVAIVTAEKATSSVLPICAGRVVCDRSGGAGGIRHERRASCARGGGRGCGVCGRRKDDIAMHGKLNGDNDK